MLGFRNIPIRRKVMVIIMATAAVSLSLAGIGLIALDSWLFRQSLKRDLAALARIIADNSTAAIAFDDARAASETLAALRARTHIEAACTYRSDGTILGTYWRDKAVTRCPVVDFNEELRFEGGVLLVSHAINLMGDRTGTIMIRYDLSEIGERASLYGSAVLGVLLLAGLMAFLLSTRLSEVIAAPVAQLALATTSVADTGDYGIRVPKFSEDELGVLVDRFNEMLAGIQSRDNHLQTVLHEREDALRRFRFMAESMPQKIFTSTPEGAVDYVNRQWTEFAGLPAETTNWGWAPLVHPDDREEVMSAWRHCIATGEAFHGQHRFLRGDGVYRWHLSRAHAMRDEAGNISMWIGSNTDIHEQKLKEEELRRANEDLQQFAYSASHDLQEPIRNVAVYSQVIASRYQTLLDPQGQQFLGFITEGGKRLSGLVTDLLAYTRAGVVESEDFVLLDAAAVLRTTMANLAEAIRESGANVTHGELPEVGMGEVHLQQLFQNLVGNGLKYRGTDEPRIHVSAERSGAAWRFCVQDNGIGIDPKYKDTIFGVFKRLHRDQRYAGTGIGLAICQRVVDLYGGRIWVESQPGAGSEFYFTVPDRAQRAA